MHREREREREREVCAHASARARSRAREYRSVPVDSQKLGLGAFLNGKKVAKGVCNVAKLATLCISISPTTSWATGQQKICAALIAR